MSGYSRFIGWIRLDTIQLMQFATVREYVSEAIRYGPMWPAKVYSKNKIKKSDGFFNLFFYMSEIYYRHEENFRYND